METEKTCLIRVFIQMATKEQVSQLLILILDSNNPKLVSLAPTIEDLYRAM
ncbi:hypothetical protein ACP26L_01150 [Paenibacillus sp. S-38]|uniref:hypothetical protein n=1 Tax=Paenibacillus sp. S-38 TaxID=3416710 RepID=UPI003CE8B14B